MNEISSQFPSFYFHDYETFGVDPIYDRPAQFAGIRTDNNLNPNEEPEVFYCLPTDDYLPVPEAVLLTGITPQLTAQKGICEAEFAKRIHQQFSRPNTCIVGYNNIRFDDEVTRNLFYRNLYDPYAYSWQNNNSRWDLLDVVRACYALRPEGIQWPLNELGYPSFKLEHLTQANNLQHEQVHDAMSDVYATIAIAKLIQQHQPKLFDYFFQLRNKNRVTALIDIVNSVPLVHISGMFGAKRGNTSWIVPLGWHPTNRNAVICYDLMGDITPLLTLPVETLKERLYTPNADLLPSELPIPLKLIHINKCPILAPINTLSMNNATRLGVNITQCQNNLAILKDHANVREKVVKLFQMSTPFPEKQDVDAQLYQQFFSKANREILSILLETPPEELAQVNLNFDDSRIPELLFRYRARNYPDTLSFAEQQKWLIHCQEKVSQHRINHYLFELQQLSETFQNDSHKLRLLQFLLEHVQQIARH